jgi:protein-S-isoprenylcysteine O-methyltransferase Ste14
MKIYPPLMVLAGLLAQLAVAYLAPVRPILAPLWQYVGVGAMALGLALILYMAASFRKNETTIIPDGQPSKLIDTGLFAYSRNPIYVAMALLLTGSGLASGHIGSLIIVPIFILSVQIVWIRKEEKNLEAEFGQIYRNYKAKVRRWL